MDSWEETLRELRAGYLRESTAKLDGLSAAIDELEATPGDEAPKADVLRRFHAFAGSGRTYGFPQVSALGLEGETRCAAFLEESQTPAAADFQGLRDIVQRMRREFQAAGVEPASASKNAAKPAA